MKEKISIFIVIVVLCSAIFMVYFVPQPKYIGKEVTSAVLSSVPKYMPYWRGQDMRAEDAVLEGDMYNFISKMVARVYVDTITYRQKVNLIILDAGNFHYPKVCFTGAGFNSKELAPRKLKLKSGEIDVRLLSNKKGKEETLSVYWICIDKQVVSSWVEQKIKQLFYSLFNKKKVGLMVRVDVPKISNIDRGVKVAEEFLNDLYKEVPEEYREYIFGE